MGHWKGSNRKRVTWLNGRIFGCEYPTLFLRWPFPSSRGGGGDKKEWRVKRRSVGGYNRSSTRSSTRHKESRTSIYWKLPTEKWTTNLWHLVSHQLSHPPDGLAPSAASHQSWYYRNFILLVKFTSRLLPLIHNRNKRKLTLKLWSRRDFRLVTI